MQLEIFYGAKYDIPRRARKYIVKEAVTSLHHYIRERPIAAGSDLLDVGGGDGTAVGLAHVDRGVRLVVVDQSIFVDDLAGKRAASDPRLKRVAADLDGDWPEGLNNLLFDTVFVLDVLEHMKVPERTVQQIFAVMKPGGRLFASTGNVAFWATRCMLFFGLFNYGRRGILDLTHTRLFTVVSFKGMLQSAGFRIDSVKCFGPPLEDLSNGKAKTLKILDKVCASLAKVWPGLFGYQILIEATRPDSIETLMQKTFVEQRHRGEGAISKSVGYGDDTGNTGD
jgi:SAM-dependent methyltransferase